MNNINDLAKAIADLNSIELNKLSDALLNEHNISATLYKFGGFGYVQTIPNTVNEQRIGQYDVLLKSAGSRKLMVLKQVKEIFGYGLKEAKDIIDDAPCYIAKSWTYDDSVRIKNELEKCGATIVINEV